MLVRRFTRDLSGSALTRAIGLVAALTITALPSSGIAQNSGAASSRSAARELLRLEDGWAAGLVKRDTAMFRRHLARDFVYTENAAVMGKEDVLKGVVGSDTVTWAGNEGMKVHSYGTTAVVTGILAMKGRGKDGAFDKRYRFTDTWKLIGGRWQIIAAQDYLIPK
jgi:ketosteroid isomerase-like protein